MAVISRGPTLGEQVYSYIRDRIVSGEYRPGQVLVESELANSLNVSRTPVSNAVIMLKERGLLEEHGGKLVIPTLMLKDVIDLYQCRLALDTLATRLAAEKITTRDLRKLERNLRIWERHDEDDNMQALWVADLEFHDVIYQVSDNQHLNRFAQIATELAAVYRRNTIRQLDETNTAISQRGREDVLREHQEIYEALKSGDASAAAQAAESHIQNVIRHLEVATILETDSGNIS
jgi:DNA-binding GntR family transcriptional regulator